MTKPGLSRLTEKSKAVEEIPISLADYMRTEKKHETDSLVDRLIELREELGAQAESLLSQAGDLDHAIELIRNSQSE